MYLQILVYFYTLFYLRLFNAAPSSGYCFRVGNSGTVKPRRVPLKLLVELRWWRGKARKGQAVIPGYIRVFLPESPNQPSPIECYCHLSSCCSPLYCSCPVINTAWYPCKLYLYFNILDRCPLKSPHGNHLHNFLPINLWLMRHRGAYIIVYTIITT